MPLLLATPSVPPPNTISLIPSLLRSQARGDESVGIESVKACQFCPQIRDVSDKTNNRSSDLNMGFNLNKVNLTNYRMKPLILHPHFGEIGSVAQLYSALDFGSSGCGLESLRGHQSGKLVIIDWFSAFLTV